MLCPVRERGAFVVPPADARLSTQSARGRSLKLHKQLACASACVAPHTALVLARTRARTMVWRDTNESRQPLSVLGVWRLRTPPVYY